MRSWLKSAVAAILFTIAPAAAQTPEAPQAWIETSSAQTLPPGAAVTLLPGSDSSIWLDVEERIRDSLEGQGVSLTETADLRLRVDLTEPTGVSVGGGPTFDLLGGGGDNSNLGLGGRVTLDFEEFDAPTSVPPQRVSMRLYQIGGGTLWLGTAETPLYGRDRADVAEDLAEALIARLNVDTPRQALQ